MLLLARKHISSLAKQQAHLPQLGQLAADHLRQLVQVVAIILVREVDATSSAQVLQSRAHLGGQDHLCTTRKLLLTGRASKYIWSSHARRLQQQQLPPEVLCSSKACDGERSRGLPRTTLEVAKVVVQIPTPLRLKNAFEDLLQVRSC